MIPIVISSPRLTKRTGYSAEYARHENREFFLRKKRKGKKRNG